MHDDSLFPADRSTLPVRIAASRAEFENAYELVYEAYLAKGYAQPHPAGLIYFPCFGLTSSRTVIAGDADRGVAGTLTIVGDNRSGFLTETTYPEEVQALREEGRALAEIACLAVDRECELPPRSVFFALTQFTIHYAFWRGYDDLLMTLHPRHYRMYQHCFRAAQIGPCRAHGVVCKNPAVACRIDLRNLKQNSSPILWQRYFADGFPTECFTVPPMSWADHMHLCDRRGIPAAAGSRTKVKELVPAA